MSMQAENIQIAVEATQEVDELSPGMRRFVDFLLEDVVDDLINKHYQKGTECNPQGESGKL